MTDYEDSSVTLAITATTGSAISLKLPPFWPSDPDVWFKQVEAQFANWGITIEKTKYDHVIASLSFDVATDVQDLILTPPSTTPYTTLKEVLIRKKVGSYQQKLQRLLS